MRIVYLILLIFGAALPVQAQSLDDFARLPGLQDPKLSPSGSHFAAQSAVDGQQHLLVIPIDSGTPIEIPAEAVDVLDYRWINDDWLVVRVGDRMSWNYGGRIYGTRLMAVRADGSQARRILDDVEELGQHASRIVWTSPVGKPEMMVQAQRSFLGNHEEFYPAVFKIDIEEGKSTLVQRSYQGVWEWIADHDGTIRFGIGFNDSGRQRRILYRPDADSGLKKIEAGRRYDDRMDVPELFLGDGRAISVARGDDGYMGVYEYDLQNFDLAQKIHAVAGSDGADVILDRNGNDIVGLASHGIASRYDWIDPEYNDLRSRIMAHVNSGKVRILSVSEARDRAIFHFGGPDQPGGYFLFDASSDRLTRLGYLNDAFELNSLHPVRPIRYKARDGLRIEAVLTIPAGKSKDLPLIVMPHGGPYARDTLRYDWQAQFLASMGYAVLQPNYRGSSGYGEEFAKAGEGEWGEKMQDDLIDGIASLAKRGIVDSGRACIVGASYGGYAAMRAAQRDAKHYRCAASFAGVSDLASYVREDRSRIFAGSRKDWLERQAPSFDQVSPLRSPESSAIPLLLVHGIEDKTVDVDHSQRMAKALRSAKKEVIFVEQKGADHHFSRQSDRREWLQLLAEFLKKHNPA